MFSTEFYRIAAVITVPAAIAIAAATFPASAQSLPDGNGKELVQTICTACHDLSPITGAGFDRAGWDSVVNNMRDMGASIKPEEVPVIVNYLTANFPPKR